MNELSSRQKQIVEAALAIVAEEGIKGLTIKAISQRVGFRDAAVYRHFQSKSDILFAIADAFENNSKHTLKAILNSPLASIVKIKNFFLDRCRTFACDQTIATVMFSEDLFKKEKIITNKVLSIIRSHQDVLLKIIREGQRRNELIRLPADHLFLLIMGSLRLLVTRWRSENHGFDLGAEGKKLWASIEKIISPQKESQ